MDLPHEMVATFIGPLQLDAMRKSHPNDDVYIALVRLNDRRGGQSDFYRWYGVKVFHNDGIAMPLDAAGPRVTQTEDASQAYPCRNGLDNATIAAMWHLQQSYTDHVICVRGVDYAQAIIDYPAAEGAWLPTVAQINARRGKAA